jgi:hypothetical protein
MPPHQGHNLQGSLQRWHRCCVFAVGAEKRAAAAAAAADLQYGSRNVLADAAIREGIKGFTGWPTIPQVNNCVGGCVGGGVGGGGTHHDVVLCAHHLCLTA